MKIWNKSVPGKGKANMRALRLDLSLLLLRDRKAWGRLGRLVG